MHLPPCQQNSTSQQHLLYLLSQLLQEPSDPVSSYCLAIKSPGVTIKSKLCFLLAFYLSITNLKFCGKTFSYNLNHFQCHELEFAGLAKFLTTISTLLKPILPPPSQTYELSSFARWPHDSSAGYQPYLSFLGITMEMELWSWLWQQFLYAVQQSRTRNVNR